MDNNMIHIDDLVRQRLRGGEEPERPGAWLTMRELLDKEMPIRAGYNWRRIVGYFTALLLLTTASVGGYRMYMNHTAGSQIASGGGRDGEGPYGKPGGLAGNGVVATDNTSTNTSASTTSTNTASNAIAANVTTPSSNGLVSRTAATAGNNEQSSSRSKSAMAASAHKRTRIAVATPAHQDATANTASVTAQAVKTPDVSNTNAPQAANQPTKADSRVYAASASATVRGHRTQRTPVNLGASRVGALQASASHSAISQPRPTIVTVKHDTIERLEIVYRRVWNSEVGRHYYRIDTFPAGQLVVDRIMSEPKDVAANQAPAKPKRHGLFAKKGNVAKPSGNDVAGLTAKNSTESVTASKKPEVASATAPVVPAAAAPEAKTASAEVGLVAANAAVAAVKRHSMLQWSGEQVQAAFNAIKQNVSRLEVYPGVMGGINASLFTPNALGGFQLGLTSLFVINDWWSLMIEPKYILRFNTGSSVRDDYKQVVDNSGSITPDPQYPGNMLYVWTDKTIRHNLNYDMVNTIEMPIMARYHWGQWYAQGGANLVFSQAIKATESTTDLNDHKQHNESRPAGVGNGTFITNDHPNVQLSDFGARFGTGYVLSGGYMFSPAVYLDMRLTQTFWDNSKSAGAKQVSKDLLRTPSIQVSVGYRFGQKK